MRRLKIEAGWLPEAPGGVPGPSRTKGQGGCVTVGGKTGRVRSSSTSVITALHQAPVALSPKENGVFISSLIATTEPWQLPRSKQNGRLELFLPFRKKAPPHTVKPHQSLPTKTLLSTKPASPLAPGMSVHVPSG